MNQITMGNTMSQITMGNTWVKLLWVIHVITIGWFKLLWVIHMSQITMCNTYETNYYG